MCTVMQVERCIVMATIAAIDSDMGWYYLSCKVCAKKVLTVPSDNYDDGDDHDVLAHNYYCPKCKTHSPKLLPRYVFTTFNGKVNELLYY